MLGPPEHAAVLKFPQICGTPYMIRVATFVVQTHIHMSTVGVAAVRANTRMSHPRRSQTRIGESTDCTANVSISLSLYILSISLCFMCIKENSTSSSIQYCVALAASMIDESSHQSGSDRW
jgi:hypothetical protein